MNSFIPNAAGHYGTMLAASTGYLVPSNDSINTTTDGLSERNMALDTSFPKTINYSSPAGFNRLHSWDSTSKSAFSAVQSQFGGFSGFSGAPSLAPTPKWTPCLPYSAIDYTRRTSSDIILWNENIPDDKQTEPYTRLSKPRRGLNSQQSLKLERPFLKQEPTAIDSLNAICSRFDATKAEKPKLCELRRILWKADVSDTEQRKTSRRRLDCEQTDQLPSFFQKERAPKSESLNKIGSSSNISKGAFYDALLTQLKMLPVKRQAATAKRPSRPRRSMTKDQKVQLKSMYQVSKYLHDHDLVDACRNLQLGSDQIVSWFQNKRNRETASRRDVKQKMEICNGTGPNFSTVPPVMPVYYSANPNMWCCNPILY